MEKVDRRIARTRKALGESLVSLALEKSYDRITIKDITERANIGYATFFRHFKTKDELAQFHCTLFMDEVVNTLDSDMSNYEKSLTVFQILPRHRETALFAAGLPRQHPAIKPLWDAADDLILEHHVALDDPTIPVEVALNHITTSVVELIRWWLQDGGDYSAEQMATLQAELIIKVTEDVALDSRFKPEYEPAMTRQRKRREVSV